MKQEEVVIEHLKIKLVIPKELADTLDLEAVKLDFIRTAVRIQNRYSKNEEK